MSVETLSLQPPVIVQIRSQRVSMDQLRDMLVRNPRDAVRWIEIAAEGGMKAAQVVWGQLLLDGDGVARDAMAAFAWFETAAAAGDLEACNMVGRCYEQGWGVAVDPKRAIDFFEIAAQGDHLWGQVNLAQMLMRAGDPLDRPRCFALFKAVAESGILKANLKAMNSLARFLEEGWAGKPNSAEAVSWYVRAARLGDHWAQYNLATILFRRGDQAAADRLLRSAVAISDNGFRRRVAPLLLAQSAPMLRQHGLDALAHCAEGQATPEDLHAYGLALEKGSAGTPDPAKAAIVFRLAAANGHQGAADRLRSKSKFRLVTRLAAVRRPLERRVQMTTDVDALRSGEIL